MRFILCADDFALSDGVSRAIIELIEAGRLSATGAMTNRPGWKGWSRALAAHAGRVDLGLHLNFTCGSPLGPMPVLCPAGELPPLGRAVRAALISSAARAEMAAEIDRQIDAFEQAMGRAPDFLDGHQHVHAMPGVRSLVLAAFERRAARPLYLRDPADSVSAINARGVAVTKAAVIAILAAGFGARARAGGLATNAGFSGVSPFDPSRDYRAEFGRYLVAPGARHLVMCHPGHADAELVRLDPVVGTRPLEFEALMKGVLPAGAALATFRQLAAQPA